MRIPLLLISLLSFSFFAQSQLNCKKLKGRYGDSTVCFHQSGTKSTVEFHDRENDRYQWFIAYDVKGNKIFEGGHGYRHGGGSLDVKYHSNGSISSVRSIFQPDGGIQYYDVTAYFAEDGSFIRREDNSWDRQLTIQPYVPTENVETVEKTKDSVHYFIKNSSGKKMTLLLTKHQDKEFKRLVILRNNKTFDAGKFERTSPKMKIFDCYRIDVLPLKRPYKTILINSPELISNEKEYLLIVHIE